jgi:transposase-like protein
MNTQCNENEVPRTLQQAIIKFSDPKVCLDFMVDLRWPFGVVCPYCKGTQHSFIKTTQVWHCKACKKRFSIKVGTIMEDSPIPLTKWLPAIWLIASAKNGISSYEIMRGLGVTQKTAWFLLHRIRTAMKNGTFEKLGDLGGDVEVDETFIGGKAANMHKDKREAKIKGRGAVGKEIVMGLLERGGEVQTKHIKNTERETLQGEVKERVTEGATVHTDALPSYKGLDEEYIHQVIDHAVAYAIENVSTNGIENFWALLKRTIKGTYVSVDAYHLERYLDEQVFRFNARHGEDADRFLEVLESITGRRLTYKQLIGNIEAS